jgi:hypothetical protein
LQQVAALAVVVEALTDSQAALAQPQAVTAGLVVVEHRQTTAEQE